MVVDVQTNLNTMKYSVPYSSQSSIHMELVHSCLFASNNFFFLERA